MKKAFSYLRVSGKGQIDGDNPANEMHAFMLVPVVLSSVSLSPVPVVGGQPVLVTAVLDGDAPLALDVEAELVNLSRVAQLVSTVATVREGARSAEFSIDTQPVDAEQSGELKVSFGGTTLTTRLTVKPR